MKNKIIEQRRFSRIEIDMPLTITPDFLGKTIELSEVGLRFTLDKPLLLTKAHARLKISASEQIDTELKVIWSKNLVADGKFVYGVSFIRLKDKDLNILREILLKNYLDRILERVEDANIAEKITNFWKSDMKEYVFSVAGLSRQIDNKGINNSDAEIAFFRATDKVMESADKLGKEITHKVTLKQVKQYFRELIAPWIYNGAIVKRAFIKPRGYPGDYRMLEDIYNNKPSSEGIGYYSDKYFLENEYAVAVRYRKEKMKEILIEFINRTESTEVKILDLACGSCREIKELFIGGKYNVKKRIILNLLDHDEESLEYSREVLKDLPTNIKANFIHKDVMALLNDSDLKSALGKQDLIYTIGLADYFPDRLLKSLIQSCIEQLKTGGKFIITHKDMNNCHPVSPDWFCDWVFYPRSQDDLESLIKSISSLNFSLGKVERERSGRIFFLAALKG